MFERVLVDSGGQNLVFTVGKDGILWKLDRKTGKYLGHKETVFQNVWESIDVKTGAPRYRQDIIDAEVGQWIDGCPSTEGGHNWQAMSHHRTTNTLVIPLSQSCIAIRAQRIEQKAGRRQRRRRRSPLLRDAGHRRQHRPARRLRRQHARPRSGRSSSARRS